MPKFPPCSACGLPFSSQFIQLAGHVRHGAEIPTYLCPRCSHGTTATPDQSAPNRVTAAYRTRVYGDHEHAALLEDDRGQFAEPDVEQEALVRRRRVQDVVQALALVPRDRPHRIMHVGCREGRLLEQLSTQIAATTIGLEPWTPWCDEARRRGVHAEAVTAEDVAPFADPDERLDLIVEHHLLEHLDQPRAHLRRLHRLLADDGVLIIEVPNLLRAYGRLETRFLQEHHRQVFTSRSLATACMRAGFSPLHIDRGANLRIFCQKSHDPSERSQVFHGANADDVFQAVWSNEARLTVKQALAKTGATDAVLELVASTHARCRWAPGRADIALEAAVALERADRYGEAATWLRESLLDRHDGEVAAMLRRIEWIERSRRGPRRRRVVTLPLAPAGAPPRLPALAAMIN
ncbi:MAG: class I SAM-dependent methyltransferase [Myxococcales bacterium FL481]|nr:MAG: class I SAM-dependent methyltransferase [Myxococcales bacterium FL481]